MRQSLTLMTWMVWFAVLGCADQHAKNKQAALDRWQTSRAQITTNLARQQFEGGQLKKAAVTVHDALSINPEYAPAHLLLGRISLEQDKLTQARDSFNTSLQLNPRLTQAHYFLGILYERRNEPDKAFQHYQLAWQAEKDNLPYLLAMVEAKAAQGHFQQALSLLLEHVAEAEHNASIYITAGNILSRQQQHDEALKMYRKAHQLNPDNTAIKEMLAFALHRTAGHAEEALLLFQELSDQLQDPLRPTPWVYHLAMGDCYMELGQFHQAQRCFERVSEQDSLNPLAWTRLAQAVLARENLDRARQCAQKALTLNPDDPDALMVLGYVSLKQKNYLQGENILRRIIETDKQNGLAYCLLGQCLAAQNKNEQAKNCYSQALKIDPHDALAQKLLTGRIKP